MRFGAIYGLPGSYSGPEVRFADIKVNLPKPRFGTTSV
jgi:hypothetical protein